MAINTTTVEVVMPAMGDSVSEGTVLEWHKDVGDSVSADETLVEISTDKVDAEVPAPVDGTVVKVHAAEGDTVGVGAPAVEPLARLRVRRVAREAAGGRVRAHVAAARAVGTVAVDHAAGRLRLRVARAGEAQQRREQDCSRLDRPCAASRH